MGNEKYIIAVSNTSKKGKTSLIKLLNAKFKIKINEKIIHKGLQKEILLVFEYEIEVNVTVKIGICSLGDEETKLQEYVNQLKAEGCQIIICACHTKSSKTFKFVESIKGYEKIFLCNTAFLSESKLYKANETKLNEIANKNTANTIFEVIKLL